MKPAPQTQLRMRESFRRRLTFMHSALPLEQVDQLVTRFAGNPKSAPTLSSHCRGGAVDLTIVDKSGVELYIGTEHDDLTPRAALDFFEQRRIRTPLEREAQTNRRLLKSVMQRAGFRPYRYEWWHWSYSS